MKQREKERCVIHDTDSHPTYKCNAFKALDSAKRLNMVKTGGACIVCLQKFNNLNAHKRNCDLLIKFPRIKCKCGEPHPHNFLTCSKNRTKNNFNLRKKSVNVNKTGRIHVTSNKPSTSRDDITRQIYSDSEDSLVNEPISREPLVRRVNLTYVSRYVHTSWARHLHYPEKERREKYERVCRRVYKNYGEHRNKTNNARGQAMKYEAIRLKKHNERSLYPIHGVRVTNNIDKQKSIEEITLRVSIYKAYEKR